MKISTRDFGELEINPEEIIEFCSPIYGFEHLNRFVMLYDDALPGPFGWLQSTEQADACFIVVDPAVVPYAYSPAVSKECCTLLKLMPEETPILRLIVVVPREFSQATVNLKSPIVISPTKKIAAQIILDEDYPLRAPLLGDGGEALPC